MAAYNAELNRRIYLAALRLTDEERRADRGVFWRSIRGTLSHILWADRMWLSRFEASERPEAALKDSDKFVHDCDDLWTQRQHRRDAVLDPIFVTGSWTEDRTSTGWSFPGRRWR